MSVVVWAVPVILVVSALLCSVASTAFVLRRIKSTNDPVRSAASWLKTCWVILTVVWLPLSLAVHCLNLDVQMAGKPVETHARAMGFLRPLKNLVGFITAAYILMLQLELILGLKRVAGSQAAQVDDATAVKEERRDGRKRIGAWVALIVTLALALAQGVLTQMGSRAQWMQIQHRSDSLTGCALQITVAVLLLCGVVTVLVYGIVVSRAAMGPVGRVMGMQLTVASLLGVVRQVCVLVYACLVMTGLLHYDEEPAVDILESITTIWTVIGGLWLTAAVLARREGGLWSVHIKSCDTPVPGEEDLEAARYA
jgi:hypothetical protein